MGIKWLTLDTGKCHKLKVRFWEILQSSFYLGQKLGLYLNKHLVYVFLFSGRVAALNMLNKPTTFESVPFFWTVLLGKSIRYTGRTFIEKKKSLYQNSTDSF